jgi:hypothetical protein
MSIGTRGWLLTTVLLAVLVSAMPPRLTLALPICGTSPNDCHLYQCNTTTGEWVVRGNKLNGAVCSDQSVCTSGDKCLNGECVGTMVSGLSDGNPCTIDACNPYTGAITHTPVVCPSGCVCGATGTCVAFQSTTYSYRQDGLPSLVTRAAQGRACGTP